jgi:hypothetical protein
VGRPFVPYKNCEKEFETSLRVPPAEFLQEESFYTFNSIQIFPFCHKAIFYLKDHFFLKEDSAPLAARRIRLLNCYLLT